MPLGQLPSGSPRWNTSSLYRGASACHSLKPSCWVPSRVHDLPGSPVRPAPDDGDRLRVALAMFAVGVLASCSWTSLSTALGIVGEPVEAFKDGEQGIGEALGLVALLGAGFTAGTAGLATLERWMRPERRKQPPIAGGSVDALTVEDAQRLDSQAEDAPPKRPPGGYDHRSRDRIAQLRRRAGHRGVREHRGKLPWRRF